MSKKILITDDEPHIRLLLEQTLEDLGDHDVEFFFAENGEIALQIIAKENPQLVLLDVMMPKMNGFDVCKTVKKDWGMAEVFIIMLTAKGQEYDKEKGQEVGANLYITKPFNPDEIRTHALKIFNIELD
jgi:DNA-binding response OmpR family regulator